MSIQTIRATEVGPGGQLVSASRSADRGYKPAVLITDADERAALAIVRSLGAAGYPCVVGGTRKRSLAGVSRYAAASEVLPDPGSNPEGFRRAVMQAVRDHGVEVVLPVSEASLLAVLADRDEIGATIPFAAAGDFSRICDKAEVLQAASKLGIRVPRQTQITFGDWHALEGVPLPVVLKPTRSVYTTKAGVRGRVGVSWAWTVDDLTGALQRYPAESYPILAQEVIQGPGIGVFVMLHDGEVVASFSHRRLCEKPPSGGVSVLRQSEPMDADLLRTSVELLRAFNWSGVAMVEYKIDAASGEPVLMEINGRFWGSLQLAIDAGIDFPRMLTECAVNGHVVPVHTYQPVRSRWTWGHIDHVIACLRDKQLPWMAKFEALYLFLRCFGPGCRGEIFRWSDIRPSLVETHHWFKFLVTRHGG